MIGQDKEKYGTALLVARHEFVIAHHLMRTKDFLLEVFPRLADVPGLQPSAGSHRENIATTALFVFRMRTPKAVYVLASNCSASYILGKVNLQGPDHFEGEQGAPRFNESDAALIFRTGRPYWLGIVGLRCRTR
jgi:hypothetical protein